VALAMRLAVFVFVIPGRTPPMPSSSDLPVWEFNLRVAFGISRSNSRAAPRCCAIENAQGSLKAEFRTTKPTRGSAFQAGSQACFKSGFRWAMERAA